MKDHPVFIIGVPRSGTTLLRIMLDSHPNLAVGSECPWFCRSYCDVTSFKDLYLSLVEDRYGPVRNFEGVSEAHVTLALGEAISSILSAYAHGRGKKRWLEKTPNHITEIPFIVKLFPQSKYIHIIRDGRDVACSSFKERVTWGKQLQNREEKVTNTRLNALQRWCRWVAQFEKWKQEYELDICQISYEDLVRNPRPTLEKILQFIEESWSEDVLNYGKQKHDIPDWEAGSRDVSQKPKISDEGIGRWKTEFSDTERLIAASFADSMLTKFGYEATLPLQSVQLLKYT